MLMEWEGGSEVRGSSGEVRGRVVVLLKVVM